MDIENPEFIYRIGQELRPELARLLVAHGIKPQALVNCLKPAARDGLVMGMLDTLDLYLEREKRRQEAQDTPFRKP